MGPGTTETQLGSHSAMRLGSEMRSKTSWMETPTVPVYVNETGRMGIIWRQKAAEMQRAAEGRQGAASVRQSFAARCRPFPPFAPLPPRPSAGGGLIIKGVLAGGGGSKFRGPTGR